MAMVELAEVVASVIDLSEPSGAGFLHGGFEELQSDCW